MNARIGDVPARFRRNRVRAAAVAVFTGAAMPVATVLALQSPQDPTSPFEVFTSYSRAPSQREVQVATDADGDAVVVFAGYGDDGDGDDSAVRVLKIDAHGRFIAPGGAIDDTGRPRRVNTTTTGAQFHPAIAMDRDGDFVVAWQGGPVDSVAYDVFFQRYDRTFKQVGPEVQVTTRAPSRTFTRPTVAMDADGDFVIAWADNQAAYGIRAQRFLADGTPNGVEFNVSNQTGYARTAPRAAMDAQGDFAVAWVSSYQDGSSSGIYARAFTADGTPRANEFRVNTVTSFSQNNPDLAMDEDGDFVVVWDDITGQYIATVNFQQYGAAGGAVGGNIPVADVSTGDEHRPSVSMAANGDFVVTWTDYSADFPGLGEEGYTPGIVARRFGADGKPIASQFRVNATTPGTQSGGDIALDADSDMAIAYVSYSGNGYLGGPLMLFRRFTGNEPVDVVIKEVPPATTEVAVDAGYRLGLTIRNKHAAPTSDGVGTATGVAVDLISSQGFFNGIVQPGWECSFSFACTAAGFCQTCISGEPVPPGGELSLTVKLQAPPDVGTATTSVALNVNQSDPAPRNNAFDVQRSIVPPDDVPDPFPFLNQANVPLSTVVTSDPFVVSGINVPAPVTVTGGRYSKNGGAFTDQPGTVVAGDSLVARHRSADQVLTATITRIDVNGEVARFRSVTEAPDSTPDAFSFGAVNDAPLSTPTVSNPITVTGINQVTPISVVGGQYNVNGSAFTANDGTVTQGDVVTVRRKSSPQPSTTVTATLTVGDVSADFDVRTVDDAVPDPFAFSAQDGVPVGSVRTSNPITVTGITVSVPIGVSGGKYSIDGAGFTSANGTVGPGAQVRVRQTASSEQATSTTATLDIGGVTGDFVVTTADADQSPDPFSFTSQTDVPVASVRVSNAITVTGITVSTPIGVDKGQYRVNGGSFTSANATVEPGDTVVVQQTSAGSPSTDKTTTLTIGDRSGTFTTTTAAPDTHPNPFTFTSQNGVPLDSLRTSNAIVVGGINAAVDIAVTHGEYSVNNLPYTASGGTVKAGDIVRVRHTSASKPAKTVTTTLTIGGVSGTFSSTTVPEDATPDAFVFADQFAAIPGVNADSNAIVVSGINVGVPISVTGGRYRINGGTYRTGAGTVTDGDQVQVRVRTSETPGAKVDAVLTIGGVSDTFSVTAAP